MRLHRNSLWQSNSPDLPPFTPRGTPECPPFCTQYDPLPPRGVKGPTTHDPLPPVFIDPAFCGGNSGLPCPSTGFEGIPQWNVAINRGQSGLQGLGDVMMIGVAQGTRIHYAAFITSDMGGPSESEVYSCLAGNLGPALVALNINVSMPFIGQASVQVDGTTSFDRGSYDDIRGDIETSLKLCKVTPYGGSISIVSTPSGMTPPGLPTSPGQVIPGATPPGPCDSQSGLNWIACQAGLGQGAAGTLTGISVGTIAVIGLLALFILTRR